eukprot:721024-Hanusia_phi.AAC.1
MQTQAKSRHWYQKKQVQKDVRSYEEATSAREVMKRNIASGNNAKKSHARPAEAAAYASTGVSDRDARPAGAGAYASTGVSDHDARPAEAAAYASTG